MLNILSHQQLNSLADIRYLVPFQWWHKIQNINSSLTQINDLKVVDSIQINDYIQTIQTKQKQAFIKLVSQKVNFLQIDNLIINEKLKSSTKWKLISSSLYDIIRKKIGPSLHLPLTFMKSHLKQQNQTIFVDDKMQFKLIKLLFCSLTQNHLFYGYIESKNQISKFIKDLLAFYQYFYTQDTKITFLETNEFRNYKFQNCQIQGKKQGQLIMIHGLERYDEKYQQQFDQAYETPQYYISSFQSPRINRIQRNGQQLTMADEDSRTLSQHTMSTGAQTPFTFAIEDQDCDFYRPYQNYGLFGQRLHQQIQHMKQYAREAIYTDIIEIPVLKQQIMRNQLEKLGDDLEQNIYKKKIYQRQLLKGDKQYCKQIKESVYYNYFKQKDGHKDFSSSSNEKNQLKDVKENDISSKALHLRVQQQKKMQAQHSMLSSQNN